MTDDYRNTEYCEPYKDSSFKKEKVVELFKQLHPKATDMHTYISDNDGPLKDAFLAAYNWKCAYCGVSIDIISKQAFEVDHFIHRKAPRFKTTAAAGYIENLVLSCHRCNHAKGDLEIPDTAHEYLHPDKPGIKTTFVRDDDFYIRIADEKKTDPVVCEFYNRLDLQNDVHRLDYLLLNMRGLRQKIGENNPAQKHLSDAIDLLQRKRNLIG